MKQISDLWCEKCREIDTELFWRSLRLVGRPHVSFLFIRCSVSELAYVYGQRIVFLATEEIDFRYWPDRREI